MARPPFLAPVRVADGFDDAPSVVEEPQRPAGCSVPRPDGSLVTPLQDWDPGLEFVHAQPYFPPSNSSRGQAVASYGQHPGRDMMASVRSDSMRMDGDLHIPAVARTLPPQRAASFASQASAVFPAASSSGMPRSPSHMSVSHQQADHMYRASLSPSPNHATRSQSGFMNGGQGAVTLPMPSTHTMARQQELYAIPPSSVPKRTHVFELEFGTLQIEENGPDILPTGWLEKGCFFVAVHCASPFIPLQQVPVPPKAPGKKVPRTKLAERNKLSCDFDGEMVSVELDRCEHMAVLDVWAQRSHIITGSEEVTLLGRMQFDLRRYPRTELNPFSIFDASCAKTGTLWIKAHLGTTPERVELLRMEDVTQTTVRIGWKAPLSDGGRPVTGFQIQLQEVDSEDQTWKTLCPRTESTINAYVVTNLTGHRRYRFEVSPINVCGTGTGATVEGWTGPLCPKATSAPQIVEVRDEKVCVCWEAPADNGGSEFVCFKVMMRKLKGASKWNPFGPSEKNAVWVDMGSVGAYSEGSHPEKYFSAWVGPLEKGCQYRFKIYAVNGVGVGEGSELSESHYT